MLIRFNKSLADAVQPRSLKEFWERVLYRPIPVLFYRAQLYEEYGLGSNEEYVGSVVQNDALLNAILENTK